MADYKYPDYTPVDEPVAKRKPKPKPAPTPAPKSMYPNSVPVDEPVKAMKSGGSVGSASKRADGCATKGKTRGKFV
jgi:hypothetical protein